jgi:hypothetical protein
VAEDGGFEPPETTQCVNPTRDSTAARTGVCSRREWRRIGDSNP